MKTKIQIKSYLGEVLFEHESEGNTIKSTLVEAVKSRVDLRGANLKKLPVDFINQCSRDMLFIFQQLKDELPAFKEKLLAGKVNGSQYEGDCACLLGTFAKVKKEKVDKVCKVIPFYEKGTHNMGEAWFLNIKEGDTPKSNGFANHVLKLIEMVETGKYKTIDY